MKPLDVALGYHARGFNVIACRGKVPVGSWQRWQNERQSDGDVRDMFTADGLNCGIITGKVSGLVVLDVDDGKHAWDIIAELCGCNPPTPCVHTPRGGLHLWFEWPGFVLPNRTKLNGGSADWRGDGGLVVVPPSDGYAFDDVLGLDTPLAPVPEPLLKLVRASPGENGSEPREWVSLMEKEIPTGKRNDCLTRIAGGLIAQGNDATSTLAILRVVNGNQCRPSLKDKEVARIVASVSTAHARNHSGDIGNTRADSKSAATQIVKLVRDSNIELFHDERGIVYARPHLRDGISTLKVDSRAFEQWIALTCYAKSGRVPAASALADAMRVLSGQGRYEGAEHQLSTRFAVDLDGHIWIDMGDESWRAIRVGSGLWEIVEDAPPLFRRANGQRALVEPVSGGDPRKILEYIPLNEDDSVRHLLLVWEVLAPMQFPRPAPVFHGAHGSAKTTAAKILRRPWDPWRPEVRRPPSDMRELAQILDQTAIPIFDNLDNLMPTMSDELAAAITGAGTSRRKLYTDEDSVIFDYLRTMMFTGINPAPQRGDLLDRCFLVKLERIPKEKRIQEEVLFQRYDEDTPEILGGLLDALAETLGRGPAQLKQKPRMADWVAWGATAADVLGIGQREFLSAYDAAEAAQNQEALDAHPVGEAVQVFMQERSAWEGTASDLLGELEKVAESRRISTREKLWPKAPNVLSRRLNEVRPNLQDVGIRIHRKLDGNRGIWIEKDSWNIPPVPPVPPKANDSKDAVSGDTGDTDGSSGDFSCDVCGESLPCDAVSDICDECREALADG